MRRAFVLLTLLALALPTSADDRTQYLWDIVVEPGETLEDVVCLGCSVLVRGTVSGDVVVIWGEVVVEGSVGSDVIAVLGGVRLGPGAKVGSDVISIGVRVDRDPTASVGDEVEEVWAVPNRATLFAAIVAMNVFLALVSLAAAGPRRVENMAATIRRRFAVTFLAGLGVAAAASGLYYLAVFLGDYMQWGSGAVTIALCIIGLPGYAGLSAAAGRLVARGPALWVAVALGAAVISLLQLLPTAGPVLFAIYGTLALGSPVVSRFGGASPERRESPAIT